MGQHYFHLDIIFLAEIIVIWASKSSGRIGGGGRGQAPLNGLMIAEMTFYGTKMIYQSVEGNEVMQSLIVSCE